MASTSESLQTDKNGRKHDSSGDSINEETAAKRFKGDDSVDCSGKSLEKAGKNGTNFALPAEEKNIFGKFNFKKVLKSDPSRKIIFIHGDFGADDDAKDKNNGNSTKDAVVILEQSAFNLDHLDQLFSAGATGELEFQNDVYHNYRAFFPQEFCGKHIFRILSFD